MEPRWDARVTAEFGGETRTFRIGVGEIRALEAETGLGYLKLWDRMKRRDCSLGEVAKIIRYGLEGMDTKADEAVRLVERYVLQPPFAEHLELASLIYGAALFLPEELNPPGKAESDGTIETAGSPSP